MGIEKKHFSKNKLLVCSTIGSDDNKLCVILVQTCGYKDSRRPTGFINRFAIFINENINAAACALWYSSYNYGTRTISASYKLNLETDLWEQK